MKLNLIQFASAVSYILDSPAHGIIEGFGPDHSRRVAYIALQISSALKMDSLTRTHLYYLSLLHDIGVSRGMRDFHTVPKLISNHCEFGEDAISAILFTKDQNSRNVILYHHERWDGTGPFNKEGRDIPLFARIIAAADHLDLIFDHSKPYYLQQDVVAERIFIDRKGILDPEIGEILFELVGQDRFWLDQIGSRIEDVLVQSAVDLSIGVGMDELKALAMVFASVIDNKSKYTSTHSSQLAEKTVTLASFYEFTPERIDKLQIAALLHDLGKLLIPMQILEKPGPLDPLEFSIMKSHAYYTKFCLSKIKGMEEIARWGANHHEKLNGKGYPEKIVPLSLEEKMLACLDVFQALSEERPYRPPMTFKQSLVIMEKMCANNEISSEIVSDIKKIFI